MKRARTCCGYEMHVAGYASADGQTRELYLKCTLCGRRSVGITLTGTLRQRFRGWLPQRFATRSGGKQLWSVMKKAG